MNTLATRKQSAAIRHQMQSIRSNLPYAMDDARDDLKQLADWKFYVRQMPLATVAGAATAAYLAVPANKHHAKKTDNGGAAPAVAEQAAESSLWGGLLGAAGAMALRAGTSIAIRHLSNSFTRARRA